MRLWISIILLFIMSGCNGGASDQEVTHSSNLFTMEFADTRTPDTGFLPAYMSWRKNEFPNGYSLLNEGVVDVDLCKHIAEETYNSLSWQDQPESMWRTSSVTQELGYGNCAEISIVIFVKWREAGIPDSNIGMAYMKKGDMAHMTPCLIINGKIVVFDLSDRSDWKLVQVFNLEKCWKIN